MHQRAARTQRSAQLQHATLRHTRKDSTDNVKLDERTAPQKTRQRSDALSVQDAADINLELSDAPLGSRIQQRVQPIRREL